MDNSSRKLSYVGKKVFIGIDVHKRTYSVVAVMEGEIIKKWRTSAEPQKLADHVKAISGFDISSIKQLGEPLKKIENSRSFLTDFIRELVRNARL